MIILRVRMNGMIMDTDNKAFYEMMADYHWNMYRYYRDLPFTHKFSMYSEMCHHSKLCIFYDDLS